MVTFGGKNKTISQTPEPQKIDTNEANLRVDALSWATALAERMIARGLIPSKDEKGNPDFQKVVSFVHATTIHLAERYLEWLKEGKNDTKPNIS